MGSKDPESDAASVRNRPRRIVKNKGGGRPMEYTYVRTGIKRQPNRLPDRSGRTDS